MSTLYKVLYTLLITSPSFLLKVRNFKDINCRENQNTNSMFNNVFKKNVPFMRKRSKIYQRETGQMTLWRRRIACWIPMATDTHLEYVIFIEFSRQKWLHKRSSVSIPRTLPFWLLKRNMCLLVFECTGG